MQVPIIVQQIRARRHIADLPLRQIDRQQIRASKADPLPRGQVAVVSNGICGSDVLLPAERDAVAGVEGEDDIVGHIGDAVAAVGAFRDHIM